MPLQHSEVLYRRGMLPFEQEEENLTRRYRRVETVERMRRIKSLKESGKTIPEIKETGQDGIIPHA